MADDKREFPNTPWGHMQREKAEKAELIAEDVAVEDADEEDDADEAE